MPKLLAAVVLLLSATLAHAQATTEVTFGQKRDKGYLLLPDTRRAAPAVLLLHDWSGPSERMLEEAKRFSARGYAVLMPDLFNGQRPATPEAARALMVHGDMDTAPDDLRRTLSDALTYLAVRPGVDARNISIVGFEMGATLALDAGLDGLNVNALVAYEPRPGVLMSPDSFRLEQIRIPVLTHLARNQEEHHSIRSFEESITAHDDANRVFLYPVVDPGFSITADGQNDAAATRLARKRTFAFLEDQR